MKNCNSEEVALKSLFLGPQAENREWVTSQIKSLLESWFHWRETFRPEDGQAISSEDMQTPEFIRRRSQTEDVLRTLAKRFEQEIPKFSPRYIGHMFSEMSLPALFGHILTLLHNPNNISGESSKVGTLIEEEAIAALSQMMGLSQEAVGHFTSGGTIANFEAFYRARARSSGWMAAGLNQGSTSAFESSVMGWRAFENIDQQTRERSAKFNPFEGNPFEASREISLKTGRVFKGPVILVPQHKHYSWVKGANVFGLGNEALWPISLDHQGRLDVQELERLIMKAWQEDRPILMVVSVLGTTELGMIDPIDQVQGLLDSLQQEKGWHLWHHVDAAYGGFMCSMKGDSAVTQVLSESSRRALNAVARVSSVTIDPHKLGYVPYSSGAFIAANRKDYYGKSFAGPYVNFSDSKDKGPFTLEGSRSAAGAVATWMTSQCVGLTAEGYGQIISRTVRLRKELEAGLTQEIPHCRLAPFVDANLLGFCIAKPGEALSKVNQRTLALYESFESSPHPDFYISKTCIYRSNYRNYFDGFIQEWSADCDTEEVFLLRICIMNPFFKSIEMKSDFQKLFVESVRQRLRGL